MGSLFFIMGGGGSMEHLLRNNLDLSIETSCTYESCQISNLKHSELKKEKQTFCSESTKFK